MGGQGDCFGHDSLLLTSQDLIDDVPPCTLSYVHALILKKSSLIEILQVFPQDSRRLRRAQVRTALLRAFVKEAKRRRLRHHTEHLEPIEIDRPLFMATEESSKTPADIFERINESEARLSDRMDVLQRQLSFLI